MSYLTAEELLAGSSVTHDIEVPAILVSGGDGVQPQEPMKVKLRPLTIRDVNRVLKAAKDDDALLSALMLKEALVEPVLTFEQVHGLRAGVARFLVEELNRISGLKVLENGMAEAIQAPMAKACFILAREFGWSPLEVGDLTMGQVLLYLEMIRDNKNQ
jgi:hypothetical protein